MAEAYQDKTRITKLYNTAEVESKKQKVQNYLRTRKLDQSRVTIYSTYFTSQFLCSVLPEILKRKTILVEIVIPSKDCKTLLDILNTFQSAEFSNELINISWEESFEEKSGSVSTNADSVNSSTYSESAIVVSIWITWCGPVQRSLASAGWKEDIKCYVFPGSWSIREMALNGIECVSNLKITDIYGNLLKDHCYAGKDDLIKTLKTEHEIKFSKKASWKGGKDGGFILVKEEFKAAKNFLVEQVLPKLEHESPFHSIETMAFRKVKFAQTMFSLVSQKIIDFKESTIEKKWRKLDCISVYDYETSNVIAFTAELFRGLKERLWSLQLIQQKTPIKPSDGNQLRDLTKLKRRM